VPNTTVQIECASEKYMNAHKNQKKDHQQQKTAGYLERRRVPSPRRFPHHAGVSSQTVYRRWFTPQSNGEQSESTRAFKSCLSTIFVRIIELDPHVFSLTTRLENKSPHRSHQKSSIHKRAL